MSAQAADDNTTTGSTPVQSWLVWAARSRWVALAGAALAVGRYALQASAAGGSNVYTDTAREFYLTDDVLGWKQTDASWFWLGLDATVPIVLAAIAAFVLVWLGRRLTDSKPRLALASAVGTILIAVALPWLPLVAFASGLPPDGVSLNIPDGDDGADAVEGTFESGEPGTYTAVANDANAIVASVTAGGEEFDVSFGQPEGSLTFDPTLLDQDTTAKFSASVADLDAGIELRTKHTREYLKAEEHASIEVELADIKDHRVSEDGETVFFDATGTVDLMGTELVLPVSGKLVQVGSEAREQLGTQAEHVYVLHANLTIDLLETPLESEIEAFDENTVPITVRIVLQKQ